MSRLLSAAELSAPVSQLPPSAYFDEGCWRASESFVRQRARLCRPRADGAECGRLRRASPRAATRTPLTRTERGVNMISNVCRHRQAIMLDGRGSLAQNGGNVVCPLHRWTYSGEGSSLARRTFRATDAQPAEQGPQGLERPLV